MMSIQLRAALSETTNEWTNDLPLEWAQVLGQTVLGAQAVDPELMLEPWEPIFPARKGRIFPGAPDGAHMLRAFDGVLPADVRVVFLGQDPYPEPASATGRAFEIGAALAWRDLDRMFSASVRAYTQSLLAARLHRPEVACRFSDWPALLSEIESGKVDMEAPTAVAGLLEAQGVLLLNASLTLSRFRKDIDPHQSRGHLRFWKPLMVDALLHIATKARPTVFIGFGDAAKTIFAEVESRSGQHLFLTLPHPAYADEYLSCPNPFLAANVFFAASGEPDINW